MSGTEPMQPAELASIVEQLLSVHTDDRVAAVGPAEVGDGVEVERHDGTYLYITITTEPVPSGFTLAEDRS